MRKHTEKPPIDDLFARKLGPASLRPSPDGFERLQARVRSKPPEARIVFWQNPTVQRYVASAACLLLVAGLGWYFWASATESERTISADNGFTSPQPQRTAEPAAASKAPKPARPASTPALAVRNAERKAQRITNPEHLAGAAHKQRSTLSVTLRDETGAKGEATFGVNESAQPTNEPTTGAPNVPTPVGTAVANVPAERVLVVTIAEPAALAAVRQAAQTTVGEQPTIAAADKSPKETKVASLWEQVKRVKQGDVFVRRTNNGDESGLLSRAYNGLKQSFDKEKSSKQ